ncbi:hypothetical protein ACX8XN_00325 [Calditrichota bacterium GD2]
MKKYSGFFIGLILLPVMILAQNNEQSAVVTTSKGITISSAEFKAYYEDYKQKIKNVKSDDWYFNLSDKIAAAKELALQKIILNEAKKNKIEQTEYFRKLKPEMEKAFQEIDQRANREKLSHKTIALIKEKIKNGLLCKAYLNKAIEPYIKVTDSDLDNFLMAHQGNYALEPTKENPKAQIIKRDILKQMIQSEKKSRIAEEIAQNLLKEYDVKINKNVLKNIK